MFSLNLKIGYKDQILWIQKCIKRKADDKEKKGKLHWLSYNSGIFFKNFISGWIHNDNSWTSSVTDNTVSVPIVPLTEENETAMEDEMFLSFLRNIGITSPANEQVKLLFLFLSLWYGDLKCINPHFGIHFSLMTLPIQISHVV